MLSTGILAQPEEKGEGRDEEWRPGSEAASADESERQGGFQNPGELVNRLWGEW